jgi:hypothetical protein
MLAELLKQELRGSRARLVIAAEVRRAPHPYIAVVHRVAVEMARDELGETNYYHGWTEENFSAAAMSMIPNNTVEVFMASQNSAKLAKGGTHESAE